MSTLYVYWSYLEELPVLLFPIMEIILILLVFDYLHRMIVAALPEALADQFRLVLKLCYAFGVLNSVAIALFRGQTFGFGGYDLQGSNASPYRIPVTVAGGGTTIMTGDQRFALVSSLYGPGNLACWFLILLSVVISWTFNPRSASRDTITNDFMAALAMPIVAVGHFFHQVYQQINSGRNMFQLLEAEWDNVRVVAAIEASLAVCEDFICWAALLHFLAGQNRQRKRVSMVVMVGWMCLSVELFLISVWIPFEKSLLIRPFLFHSVPLFVILVVWFALAAWAYLVEVICSSVFLYKDHCGRTLEPEDMSWRRVLRSGRVSSWMAACAGSVAGLATIWIKYGWLYPVSWSDSVRVMANSTVHISDLDQVVTMVGGLLTLSFSIHDAFKERKKSQFRKDEED